MASTAPPSTVDKPDVKIVTDIPPELQRALLLIVKNFFSPEHFLIVYYIMTATCIREENLRTKLQYDQKELRQKLAGLKSEKLVKERLLQQKNDNNRSISIIFYFINYRAIINVLMYKVDHMRQKLEAREKEDTQKAIYKCSHCAAKYETLDVDRLLDPLTATLKCWRCGSEVVTDETGGPSQVTRSLLAKFNEQLHPLFVVAQDLKGVQLAPHLLEPDITKFLEKEESDAAHHMSDALDFSQYGGDRASLGGKAFSGLKNATTLRYAHGDEIIVDLNADSSRRVVEETRQVPLWLQDDAIAGVEQAQAAASLDNAVNSKNGLMASTSTVTVEMLRELEKGEDEPDPKRIKIEKADNDYYPVEIKKEEEDEEEEEGDEDEVMVYVAGERVPLSEVTGNEDLIGKMTDEEKEEYERIWQEQFAM